jgi:site-specific DNA-methyltransferase (adenine-specific)
MSVELFHGDCFEYLQKIPDGTVDLVLTDPPYGVTACHWDKVPDLPRLFSEFWRVLKPTGTALIFGQEPFSTKLRVGGMEKYKYDLYWLKRHVGMFVHAKNRPLPKIELISVFSKGVMNHVGLSTTRMTYNPQGARRGKLQKLGHRHVHTYSTTPGNDPKKVYLTYENFPDNVLHFKEATFGKLHPNEKPVKLLTWLIKSYSNEGETVLDPFMGSGSTGDACRRTGRKFIGCEMDDEFFKIAEKRIAEAPVPPTNGEIVLVKPNDPQGYLIFEEEKVE